MSHPTRLNAVIARAVTGSKTSLQWYHKNYLDHVYAVSNKRGRLREHYRYTAFGEVTIYDDNGNVETESQIENTIMWNTRRRDTVTGFYLYKYRHYDPQLGRWPSRDPIEEDGGVNLYAFVGNDPVGKWDELGLAWRCETTHSRSCEGESTEEDEGAGDTTFVSTCSFVPCEYMEVIGYGASSDRGTAMLFSYLDAVSKNLGDCPEGCTGNDLFSSTTCEEIDTSA